MSNFAIPKLAFATKTTIMNKKIENYNLLLFRKLN